MQEIYPDYYARFSCLAGACPDTCCKDWEVAVDTDTAALYRSLNGKLGCRIRDALVTDEDGDLVLRHEAGACPLLDRESGLCSVQSALGHGALCRVCREYPRLTQDFTSFREHSLSLSCPEAARLILTAPNLPELRAEGRRDDLPVDYDLEDLALLERTRQAMFRFLAVRALPISRRIGLCLLLAEQAQALLDGDAPAPFDPEAALEKLPPRQEAPWKELLDFYLELDILLPKWRRLLECAAALPPENLSQDDPLEKYPQEFANLFFDGVYRELLCAVADFDLLPRVKAAALSCALSRMLIHMGGDADRLEVHRLYAKEITHCSSNHDALLDACCPGGIFSTSDVLSLLF